MTEQRKPKKESRPSITPASKIEYRNNPQEIEAMLKRRAERKAKNWTLPPN
jgi:hypothetical protein